MVLLRPRNWVIGWIAASALALPARALPQPEPVPTRSITGAPASRPSADTTASASASTRPADPAVDDAIDMLSSGSYEDREKAATLLWSMGDRAIPALRDAAGGDDPETSRRARSVLDNFAYGIRPDTPRDVLDLLGQYRAGPDDQRQAAIRGLAEKGAHGARVLMRIVADEHDASVRRAVVQALTSVDASQRMRCRIAAAELLGEQDFETAKQLLALVSAEKEATARDYATILALRGGIDDEILRLERIAAAPVKDRAAAVAELPPTIRLVYLYRAKGQSKLAMAAATRADANVPVAVVDALRIETGDWKGLAAAVEQRGVTPGSIEDLGYITAYERLAGNTAAAEKWAAQIVDYAKQNPPGHWDAAEALLLNDRPDQAIEVLRDADDFASAIQFLNPRLQMREAAEELEKAKEAAPPEYARIQAKAIGTLHFMGKYDEARQIIEGLARGESGVPDFATYVSVLEAARMVREPIDQIDTWLTAALEDAKPFDDVSRLFDRAGFDRPDEAAQWWQLVRDPRSAVPRGDRIAKLRAIDHNEISEPDLKELCATVERLAADLGQPERDERMLLVAQTMSDVGRIEEAQVVLEKLAQDSPTVQGLVRLGDVYAQGKLWSKAAEVYAQAFDRDHGQPAPLLLEGWALVQSGQAQRGAGMIETAHQMPLADEGARHTLMELLMKRGLTDEAARERDLILRTSEFGSWERGDALRRAAEDASNRGDHAAAADMWDCAFLNNLGTRISFVEPTANLMIPVMIHRTRAQAAIKAGQIAEALREAQFCLQACPGDADSQISIVEDFDAAGRKGEADAVFAAARSIYVKTCEDYPKSGPAHNLFAWFEAKCKRDLDEALTHAKAACDIEPDNAAILDTLAEVYFQQGQTDRALELVRRCIKLEPNSEHHKKNLERLEAAKAGK